MIFWTTVNQVPCVYEALIPALQNVRSLSTFLLIFWY